MPYREAPEDAQKLFDRVRNRHHSALQGAVIKLIMAPGKLTVQGREINTKTARPNPREHDLQGVEAWVIINPLWWVQVRPDEADGAANRQARERMIMRSFDHSLCELSWDEDAEQIVIEYPHGEFAAVIRRWGVPPGSELERVGDAFVARHQMRLPFGEPMTAEDADEAAEEEMELTLAHAGRTVKTTAGELSRAAGRAGV